MLSLIIEFFKALPVRAKRQVVPMIIGILLCLGFMWGKNTYTGLREDVTTDRNTIQAIYVLAVRADSIYRILADNQTMLIRNDSTRMYEHKLLLNGLDEINHSRKGR